MNYYLWIIFFFQTLHWHHRSFVSCKLNVSCPCQQNQPVETDLHQRDAKSSIFLILFQSHSGSTAGTALITAHLTPHCLSSSPRFLTNSCICSSHLPQPFFPAGAQSSEMRWPPQEPAWKGTAGTHSLFSPSVHPPFTALDAGKWNALIALHKSALHLYFWKPKAMESLGDEGESSTNSVCYGKCCGHQDPETPGPGEFLQVSTELLGWLLLLHSHSN